MLEQPASRLDRSVTILLVDWFQNAREMRVALSRGVAHAQVRARVWRRWAPILALDARIAEIRAAL